MNPAIDQLAEIVHLDNFFFPFTSRSLSLTHAFNLSLRCITTLALLSSGSLSGFYKVAK